MSQLVVDLILIYIA